MKLRPHQIKAVEMLRDSLRRGKHRPVLAAPCSFGKTITAAYLLSEAAKKGRRGIFICDRVKLVQQALDAFDREGLDVGVMQGQHERQNYRAPIQIASIQTIARRKHLPEFDFAIVDECFVAGTMVKTTAGPKPIENVRLGDKVYNACGVGQVVSCSAKASENLVEVAFNDGTKIRCTANHPFFTESGWTQAGELALRQRVFRHEDMPSLWDGVWTEGYSTEGSSIGSRVGKTKDLLNILLEEAEEPNALQGIASKDAKDAESYWAQAESQRREWSGAYGTAADDAGLLGRGLASRVHSKYGNEDVGRKQASAPLQDRRSEPRNEDSDGNRRIQPLLSGKAGAGQKENSGFGVLRVESVTPIECGSGEIVYNLGISGHPSYFAEGVLVHNCHVHYKTTQYMMDRYTAVPFIGLSATPYSKGLGRAYNDLVIPITPEELLEQKYLCPVEYYGGANVDTSKIKPRALQTGGSDFDPKDLAKATEDDERLVGDIVRNWFKYAEGRQTIAFSPSIKHSKEMVDIFNANGVPAVHIDGYMDPEERSVIFDAHDRGEFLILSCSRLLNTGYDAPKVSCLIDCFPTRSTIAYVQRAGRIMRTYPSKEQAIYLDHAGNVARHGFAEHIIPEELHDGEKAFTEKAQVKKDKEKKVHDCPQCHGKFTGLRCRCGYEILVKEKLESDNSDLKKLTPEKRNRVTPGEEKARWLSELCLYAVKKGYKAGWASHQYRKRFGVWPNKIQPQRGVKGLSPDVQAFIIHNNIRRAHAGRRASVDA